MPGFLSVEITVSVNFFGAQVPIVDMGTLVIQIAQ